MGVVCAAFALWLSGCGGAVEHSGDGGDSGANTGGAQAGGKGGATSSGGSGSAGKPSKAGSSGMGPGEDLTPVTTGCSQDELPPPQIECDAYSAGSCGPGFGCYPFVSHPEGRGCDAQTYGTLCLPAGSGTQGMSCGDETGDFCAPGFVCVVGQRAGKRCAALCQIGVLGQCQGGLICGDLDVAGFGVCG